MRKHFIPGHRRWTHAAKVLHVKSFHTASWIQILCLPSTVCIFIKHTCETHLWIPPHVQTEVREASRISCSAAAAASVLGTRASASHPQIYNQAEDEFSSASLTPEFHQNELPHLLLRWRQTLSRRALSWQSDHHVRAMARPAPAEEVRPEEGGEYCWPHIWDHTLWKGFQIFWIAGGMRTKENMWTDLYIMKCRWRHLSIFRDSLKGHSSLLKSAKKHANVS